MSLYVVCKFNKDNEIQGYIEPSLNPKLKYEVALVEIIYTNLWIENFGSIN